MNSEKKKISVIILCGGQGTRLREETEYKPKPMVEIGGKPILWHIMKIYSFYGFNNFILALGYKGYLIKNYFLNYKYYNNDFTLDMGKNGFTLHEKNGTSEKNWTITFVDTGENSMTGARIKNCSKYINTENFAVTYGDGVSNVNLEKEFQFHVDHNKAVTMLGVNPLSKFGELVIDGDQVMNFSEKPQVNSSIINGGYFFMKKRFLNYLDTSANCILENGPLEKASLDGEVMIYKHRDEWYCMDTYRDYLFLNDMWGKNKRPWAIWEK
ncbi:MAG: glucose-1-phosphate cytidylyltransferase [Melioribacteraceae bacterium]|nr:glucose-1-phosphate cytidylyltransferase [Melioribacteraceae bacterium]